jgi:steroid delta-isomerase-like uncharacterized protein
MPLLLSATILLACSAAEDAPQTRNIETVTLQHSEVWSNGNLNIVPAIYTEDFVAHAPGGKLIQGQTGLRTMVQEHRAAFPDWNEEVEQLLVDGEFVVTRFRSTGTHQGLFLGHPATGNNIEITETCIYRMVEGRIAEQWIYPDIASLQEQLSRNHPD